MKTYSLKTYTFKIYHNNELKQEFNKQINDLLTFRYMQKAQSQSIGWAIKYEGWKVEQINEETNEITYWEPL